MKDMIQKMTLLENEQITTECGMDEGPMGMPPAPEMDRGNPVTMNVSLNASGKEHVEDLINMMKNAGMGGAKEVSPDMMPMRTDMERLRDIVDGPKMALPAPEEMDMEDDIEEEGYDNEPDEKYGDVKMMTKDLAGGINKAKKSHRPAAGADNPMSLESEIFNKLKEEYAELKNKD
jgi:hypothetical protein